GEGGACRRNGERIAGARFRARGGLSRPARRPVGGAVAAGDQSARGGGSRRVRDPSVERLQLRAGVLLPHRTELGQPRVFSEGRPFALVRRSLVLLPRAI